MNFKKPYKLFIAALTGCFFLYACENDEKLVANLNKKAIGVEEAKNVRVVYTTGGKTKAILTAPLMLRVQDTMPYYEFPKTLHTDFYDENGVIESKLSAKYARYKETQSIVFLKDSVKVVNILKGDTLYCEELYWNRSRIGSEFYTDKPVKIRTRTQTLDGVGMEARQDFKKWLILKPRGPIQVPASKFPM
ncbi:MAG: LPS export ABC transporter periplasmic protein LptC [Ferruginibacter sp.]